MRKLTYKIIRLDASNVAERGTEKTIAQKRGEELFKQFMQVQRANFPASEVENKAQFRSYFHDEFKDSWFVKVAVKKNKDGKEEVIGIRTYSYKEEMNLIMLNITVVKQKFTQQGVSRALENDMLVHAEEIGKKNGSPVLYAIAEVERPDFKEFAGEEGLVRNVKRPAYHDKVSKRRAIRLANGEPLIYNLPIMATDAERESAKKAGTPIEEEPLMFCIRPLASKEGDGINAKEAARLLYWFFKGYLQNECSDVKATEVSYNLALALSTLTLSEGKKRPSAEKVSILLDRIVNWLGVEEVLKLIPDRQLSFMKVGETALNKN